MTVTGPVPTTAPPARPPVRHRRDWGAIRAVVVKDMVAIRRSKAIMLPMMGVPFILLVGLPEVFRVAAEYRVLIYGLVLLLLVRFRPQGLMGTV